MDRYQKDVFAQLLVWQKMMIRRPSILNNLAKKFQTKVNTWIPEKVHKAITGTIKQMIRGVLFGARYTTSKPLENISFELREIAVMEKINIKFIKSMTAGTLLILEELTMNGEKKSKDDVRILKCN